MCGIAGIYRQYIEVATSHHSDSIIEDVIHRMTSTLSYRGPDSSGIYVDEKIALGHRRLKILDLTDTGSQPMMLETNGFRITYNGEIYNYLELKKELQKKGHIFRGRSDTEVILHVYKEWGIDGLKRLEGIFAFAIWDPIKETLILFRDRLGIKPLYYAKSSYGFVFGSEIKTLLQADGIDCSLDEQSFSEYLWFGNTYEDRTFYRGIKSLLPGHYFEINKKSQALKKWWKIEKWTKSLNFSKESATSELREAIDESVGRQLNADVPVGIFLSGGIDSSAIAAAAANLRKDSINCYSASFDFDGGINEQEKAALVAKHLNVTHHQLKVKGPDIVDTLYILAKAHDEPFADAANIPLYLMCKHLEGDVKVVLQGDGGDELFGGYRRYNLLSKLKYLKYIPNSIADIFFQSGSRGKRISRILRALNQSEPSMRMALLLTLETLNNRPELLLKKEYQEKYIETLDPFLAYRNAAERFNFHEPIQQMLLTDLTVQLPSQFLTKVDRASMAAGIEARVPLLDEKIARLSVGMPTAWKISSLQDKVILRNSQKERLPSSILKRPKTGFGVPYEYWLRSSLFDFAKERLLDNSFLKKFNFDPSLIEKTLDDHKELKAQNGFILWKLLQISLWMETRHNEK